MPGLPSLEGPRSFDLAAPFDYTPFPKDDSVDESFDVHSLARFLHLPPDQVQKMAERGKLPGRKLVGQWRFDRAEIFHWFEERIGLSGDVELQKVEQVLDSAAKQAITDSVSLNQLLDESLVWLDCPARNKNSLISDFCQRIADTGRLWQPVEMAAAVRSREELHPTAMENGVALLHPRRPQPTYFDEPFVAIAITPSGIPCGGPKGALTDIFFLLASSDDAFHLRLLARISRLVNQAELLQKLRAAQSAAEVCATLHDADEQLS